MDTLFTPCLYIVHTFLPPKKGQPLNNGQNARPQCSEVPFTPSLITHHFYVPLTPPPSLSVMFVTVGWMKQLQQCLMHYAVCYELVCFSSSSPLQARQPGEFFLEKLSVKVGSLDFTISSPAPHGWWAEPLVITKKTEGIFISLLPTLGSEPCLLLSSLNILCIVSLLEA